MRDWLSHPEPGEYWASRTSADRFDRIRVPALHIAGWFDAFLEGSIEGFLALERRCGKELARENQYLLAGPWEHIPWGDRVGEANLGEEAILDTDALLLRWFNHWLKDSGEFAGEPRIHPRMGAETTRLH